MLELEVKRDLLAKIIVEIRKEYREEWSHYRARLRKFADHNKEEIDLERAELMLRTSKEELAEIEKIESHKTKNGMLNGEPRDHLPF